jgi:hypothetical protein
MLHLHLLCSNCRTVHCLVTASGRYQELLPKVATRPGGSRTLLVTRHKDKLLLARSGPPAQATLQKQHQQPPSVEEVAVRYVRLIGGF